MAHDRDKRICLRLSNLTIHGKRQHVFLCLNNQEDLRYQVVDGCFDGIGFQGFQERCQTRRQRRRVRRHCESRY
jgi:hypothetical protein